MREVGAVYNRPLGGFWTADQPFRKVAPQLVAAQAARLTEHVGRPGPLGRGTGLRGGSGSFQVSLCGQNTGRSVRAI